MVILFTHATNAVLKCGGTKGFARMSIPMMIHNSQCVACVESSTFLLNQPPQLLRDLLENRHEKSRHFQDNIRSYNMFSFTSMGGAIDWSVNQGSGPYSFRFKGQNLHYMGSLLPDVGKKPKFTQIYIYDPRDEVKHRRDAASNGNDLGLDEGLVGQLLQMMDDENCYAHIYQSSRECINENPSMRFTLKLIGSRSKENPTYNPPITSKVTTLIV